MKEGSLDAAERKKKASIEQRSRGKEKNFKGRKKRRKASSSPSKRRPRKEGGKKKRMEWEKKAVGDSQGLFESNEFQIGKGQLEERYEGSGQAQSRKGKIM